jgi:succinoglycan biosynthesis transport protein ExoP
VPCPYLSGCHPDCRYGHSRRPIETSLAQQLHIQQRLIWDFAAGPATATLSGVEPNEDRSGVSIKRYALVIWRQKSAVLAMIAFAVLVSGIIDLVLPKAYTATATVLLEPNAVESSFGSGGGQNASTSDIVRRNATLIQLVQSPAVGDQIRTQFHKNLGALPSPSVQAIGQQTDLITISITTGNKKRAATMATAWAKAFINARRTQAVGDLQVAIDHLQPEVALVQTQIDKLNTQVAVASPTDRAFVQANIASTRQAFIQQQTAFIDRINQFKALQAVTSGGTQLVAAAGTPGYPSRPRPLLYAALAAVAGLLLGIVLAFVRESLDDRLRSTEELERLVPGVAVLSRIPRDRAWTQASDARLVSVEDPHADVVEAYRNLRTAINVPVVAGGAHSILVTSPDGPEGKSATTANLAVVLARAGCTVVAVDANLRRPRLHEYFLIPNDSGLATLLAGEAQVAAVTQSIDEVPGLSVVTAGPVSDDSPDLLAGPRLDDLLAAFSLTADVVLVDAPPVLAVSDPSVVARRVATTVLVVSVGQSLRKSIVRAVDDLTRLNAGLGGLIVNQAPDQRTPSRHRYVVKEGQMRSGRSAPATDPAFASLESVNPPADSPSAVAAASSGPGPTRDQKAARSPGRARSVGQVAVAVARRSLVPRQHGRG